MSGDSVCALVGGVGGAGTTRLALEFAGTLARDGRSVLVVDAAYATQGLATAVPAKLTTDVTAAVTEDRPLAAATYEMDLPVPGRVAVAPAEAPFERLARSKTSECARRLAERISAAVDEYDHVLVDVPPVAANPAVAAVTAADRVCLVVPDTERGADAVPSMHDRLADVDAAVDTVVATRAGDSRYVDAADVAVPESDVEALSDAPVCLGASEFGTAVAAAAEAVFEVNLDLAEPETSSFADYLTGR